MRLERRLANQNALTSTRESKESEGPGEANTERFEGRFVMLLSEFWSAMRRRTCNVSPATSGRRAWYDSTRKAVIAAEKSPAYRGPVSE